MTLPKTATPVAHVAETRWYACRTRARAEKQVDRLLTGRVVQSFLPLIEKERQWADRKKRVRFPLFPGYTFARFALEEIRLVLCTPGLASIIHTGGRPTPLDDQEIESVRLFVDGVNQTGQIPMLEYDIAVGQKVVVTAGPFEGMCGTLVEQRGRAKVIIEISAIRQAMSVELDPAVLRQMDI